VFASGDQVVYGIHGVCNVLDLEKRYVDKKNVEYYVLEPTDQPGSRYYVPTQNPAAVAKLRPILSKQELDALLSSEDTGRDAWIPDENLRKHRYRELIGGGDRAALICMVRSLHKQKSALLASGRKFHLCDENFLKDAEKLLSAEFSLVLNIQPNEVGQYIKNAIGVTD